MANPRDLNDIPAYPHGECPVCRERSGRKGKCWECKKTIPFYSGMRGHGYQSATIHHFHEKQTKSRFVGKRAINSELCLECYLKDYKDNYGFYPELQRPGVETRPVTKQKELEKRIEDLEKMIAAQANFQEMS